MVEVFGVMNGHAFSEIVERSRLLETIMKYQGADQGPFPRPYVGQVPVIQPEPEPMKVEEFEDVPF